MLLTGEGMCGGGETFQILCESKDALEIMFVGASKMTQQTKALASEPNDLSSLPRACMVMEGRTMFYKLSSDIPTCALACACPYPLH